MSGYIIKDGVRYTKEESLFENRSFRDDMLIALAFLSMPVFAWCASYLCDGHNNKQERESKTEFAQPKEDKVGDMQSTLKFVNFIRQR